MKRRSKMIWILSAILFLVAFWFYNFRWVEFIPVEYKDQGVASLKSPYIKRPEWITEKNLNCFKIRLDANNHDYIAKDKKLYVRAYVASNYNLIDNIWEGSENLEVKKCDPYGGGVIPSGFFINIMPHKLHWFGQLLDKLIMWRWDEKGKK